jgi:hypothetical protein
VGAAFLEDAAEPRSCAGAARMTRS